MKSPLLAWTDQGLYCSAGDFYIDPHKPVDRAVVTHAHSDHARRGSRQYFCVKESVGLMRLRLGQKIEVSAHAYGEKFQLGPVTLSFHSAGHMLGSAQIRVEHEGRVWVASGDYKRDPDPTCAPFEVVRCNTFVTEATFGTPSFRWQKSATLGQDIYDWWQKNRSQKRHSLLLGYSIGKAQRLMGELRTHMSGEPIWIHPTVEAATQCYRDEGVLLPETRVATEDILRQGLPAGSVLIAPPSVQQSAWTDLLGNPAIAFASGWMSGTGSGPGRAYEQGFIMSDHADWPDLLRTIEESGAQEVYVLHRGNGALVRHLKLQGLRAYPIEALRVREDDSSKQLSLF